jgi:Flp pilus assembly protein TadB
LDVSFNGADWYSVGTFKYRPNESLSSVAPTYVPYSGGTLLTLTASNYESAGQCRFASSSVKSPVDASTLTCKAPATSELSNASSSSLSISSNDQDYFDSKTLTYYPDPSVLSVSPELIYATTEHTFTVTTDNLINTGLLKAKFVALDSSSEHTVDAEYNSSTSLKFTITMSGSESLSIGLYIIRISVNGQQYSEATDYVRVIKNPTLTSIFPQHGQTTGTMVLLIEGLDFTNLDLWCKIGTDVSVGTFIDSKHINCDKPTGTADTVVQVAVSYNQHDFTNSLDFTYMSSPSFASSSLTAFNQEESAVSLSMAWSYEPVLVQVGDWVISQDFTYTSNVLSFSLPRQPTGSAKVMVSANWLEFETGPSVTFKGECEAGYFCSANPSFVRTECQAGFYCSGDTLRRPTMCSPGSYSSSSLSTSCLTCPTGEFCPRAGLSSGLDCPDGYLCSSAGLGRLSSATVCPAGKACMANSASVCPALKWCGEGAVYSSLYAFADFRTPQTCHDGVVCTEESKEIHGVSECYAGYYCKLGELIACQPGYYCPNTGMNSPFLCNPGTYINSSYATACTQCSKGYICPGSGNTSQTPCPAGDVCAGVGKDSFTNACPAGYYCLEGLSDISQTNTPNGPKSCPAKTFCLLGVAYADVKDGDISHPQSCIAGSFCPAGTSSPSDNPCPEGYYCPANSEAPISAREMRYAIGQRNVLDTPCAPGTYSNSTGLADCLPCPGGYECPDEETLEPTICGQGKYRDDSQDDIYCSLCPQGTWSNKVGVTSVNGCAQCPEAVVCSLEGMTDLSLAEDCREGYICEAATTSYSILNSQCLGGFYCGTKASTIADMGICEAGYYCPEGTQASSSRNHPCITGYFCPPATNAELNLEGRFSMIEQVNYTEIIEAKIAANSANCTLYNSSLGCETYQIPIIVECEEDQQIPDYIKARYTSLLCPDGTTSSKNAQCVGQCVTTSTLKTIKTVNPFATQRVLADNSNLTLDPAEIGIFSFDLTGLEPAFRYAEHFTLQVTQSAEDGTEKTLALPGYFANANATKHTEFRLSVMNFGETRFNFSMNFALHNALWLPVVDTLSATARSAYHSPSRAKLNSDKLFVAIVFKDDFNGVELPNNLIEFDTLNTENPLIIDVGLNSEWNGTVASKSLFDDTYWLTYELTTVSLPWLPFFMNCEYFGDHVYLYELLELMEECTLYSADDTVYVRPIPTTGFEPTSDKCDLAFTCFFSEDTQFERSGQNYWFNLDEDTVLFYLHKKPQDWSVLFERSAGSTYDSTFTSDVKDLSDNIIPVTFMPDATSGLPSTVELSIDYFQKDSTTKSIVKASVRLMDYSTSSVEKPSYTLKVKFRSMNWLDLLESYQLDLSIYSLVYVVIMIAATLFIYLLYFIHWLIARFKSPPKLHFKQFFALNSLAPSLGVFYSSAAVFICIAIIYGLHKNNTFKEIGGDWEESTQEDEEAIKRKASGRLGIWLLTFSMILLYFSSCILIPKPEDEQLNESGSLEESSRVLEEVVKGSAKGSSTDSLKPDNTTQESSTETVQESKPYAEGMTEKRMQFMLVCCCSALLVTWKLELSYSDTFTSNIIGFLVIFLLIDMLLEYILQRFVIGEALLVAPNIASMSAINIFISMAAKDFSDFLVSYSILVSFLIFTRLYFKPFSQWASQQFQKFSIYLMARSTFFERLLKQLIERQLTMRIKLLSVMNSEFSAPAQMEGLMDTMLTHASHKQSVFTLPFLLTLVIMFADETQIPREYEIRQSDVQYYLLFSLVVILPTLICDVWIFHILESLFNYKLFDYFTFCRFRYKTRSAKWINEVRLRLDRSLLLPWRSLDQMCFSSQYYFSVTTATWGILTLAIAWSILLRNSYNFYSDPALLIIITIMASAQLPIRKVFSLFSDALTIWKQRAPKIFIGEEPSDEQEVVKLIDEYVEENALLTKIQTNLYKSKFVKKNKEWIIANIDRLSDNHTPVTQYLSQLYRTLFNEYMAEVRAQRQADERRQQLQIAEEMKHSRLEEAQESHIRQLREPTLEADDVEILYHWLDQACIARKLKEHINLLAFPSSECDECGLNPYADNGDTKRPYGDLQQLNRTAREPHLYQDATSVHGPEENLHLVGTIDFYELLTAYRSATRGIPLSLNRFRAFYLTNQKMLTLCDECRTLRDARLQKDTRVAGLLTQIAAEGLKYVKEPKQVTEVVPNTARRLAMRWLFEARSRLLHNGKDQLANISRYSHDLSQAFSSRGSLSLAVSSFGND